MDVFDKIILFGNVVIGILWAVINAVQGDAAAAFIGVGYTAISFGAIILWTRLDMTLDVAEKLMEVADDSMKVADIFLEGVDDEAVAVINKRIQDRGLEVRKEGDVYKLFKTSE